MTDPTILRFERRRLFSEYGGAAAVVASWGAGLWLVANLIDIASLLAL